MHVVDPVLLIDLSVKEIAYSMYRLVRQILCMVFARQQLNMTAAVRCGSNVDREYVKCTLLQVYIFLVCYQNARKM